MEQERIVHQPISPVRQSREASCAPASISMVLSGFGVALSEDVLVRKYFPDAELPIESGKAGVRNDKVVEGIVSVLKGENLPELMVDVFDPSIWKFVRSPKEKYITPVSARVLRKVRDQECGQVRDFYENLANLAGGNDIRVYTVNSQLVPFRTSRANPNYYLTREVIDRFYKELTEFIKKGHIVGPHAGMTRHVRVLDGKAIEGNNFWLIDPNGESYETPIDHLLHLDSYGLRGNIFDYLIRVAPKEEEILTPESDDFRSLFKYIRDLIPWH